nr:hypothetical protein [Primorskyibacter flagellatus]
MQHDIGRLTALHQPADNAPKKDFGRNASVDLIAFDYVSSGNYGTGTSSMPGFELAQSGFQIVQNQRLAQEKASRRKVHWCKMGAAGNYHNMAASPHVPDISRQGQPVHRARHVDVSDQKVEIYAVRNQGDRFVCICCLADGMPQVEKTQRKVHPDYRVILDKQDFE